MTAALLAGMVLVGLSLIGALMVALSDARAQVRDLERLIEIAEEVVFKDDDAEREEVAS